jgi:ATP-binding cassette subfamily C (CFTR/MRP) protein 4
LLTEWSGQPLAEQQKPYYPGMFGGSILAYVILCILRAAVIFMMVHTSTTNMHNDMSFKVLRAKILFFDSNPIGRVVTRFSKDVGVLDFIVPTLTIFIVQGIFRTITVAITVSIINPYLFIAVFFGGVFMVLVLRKGTPSMIVSQGFDGQLRGPIHTTFAMIINGLVSLRAADKLKYFKQDFNSNLEKCANATFCYALVNRWLGLRLDMICVLFSVATTAIAFS